MDPTKSCPLHERSLSSPTNTEQAFVMQLHEDVVKMFRASTIAKPELRKRLLIELFNNVKIDVQHLENLL